MAGEFEKIKQLDLIFLVEAGVSRRTDAVHEEKRLRTSEEFLAVMNVLALT